ncbi:hypothetical protein HMPREF0321_0852 [Dermacoccus sp. Ellin185]|nr:hypothetical protein HMPREF0321_0852 [Dermacoccus sp. Ellin185]
MGPVECVCFVGGQGLRFTHGATLGVRTPTRQPRLRARETRRGAAEVPGQVWCR